MESKIILLQIPRNSDVSTDVCSEHGFAVCTVNIPYPVDHTQGAGQSSWK